MFGTQDHFSFDFDVYLQVLMTRLTPVDKTALFKAIGFQQEQTCCIPFTMLKKVILHMRNARECG